MGVVIGGVGEVRVSRLGLRLGLGLGLGLGLEGWDWKKGFLGFC